MPRHAKPGPEVFKGPFLPPVGPIMYVEALSLAQCYEGLEFPGASPSLDLQVTDQRTTEGRTAAGAEEVGWRGRTRTRGVGRCEHIWCRCCCFCGRAASTLMDLEAICKADQRQVVFQPWQMVPGWTNVTFPWINNLTKIDEEDRHTCPLLDYLNISLCPSFPELLTK